ncbi:UNVERIFIED_CONTAM: hypothetical protein GTU68_048106 [Idotea baltica]|nr:hypothetical protein [Idotea baltica]
MESGKTDKEANFSNVPNNPSKNEKPMDEKWGFDLYPERRSALEPTWSEIVFGGKGTEASERLKCERRVWNVVNKSPLIKLMLGALKSAGCPVDLERHIACEVCDNSLLGGYDQELNQVVICQNVCTSEGRVQAALSHELVHMFDYCKNKVDFSNLDHLACAEIKAANLTSCSFLTSLTLPRNSYFSVARTHQDCVKIKAVWSMKYARNITEETAMESVDRVFPKCYNDLEPLGRRPRRNSYDFNKAYRERYLYGYV